MVGLDLRGQLPDVTMLNAKLPVAGAMLFVACADLFVPERFQLCECFFERHVHPWSQWIFRRANDRTLLPPRTKSQPTGPASGRWSVQRLARRGASATVSYS